MASLNSRPIRRFSVLHLVLESGERLPCLVDAETWIPVRVANRWAVRFRRLRTQSSTLTDNLRILGKVYSWAWTIAGFDLDDYLTSGELLRARQIESLAAYLRTAGKDPVAGPSLRNLSVEVIDTGTYDHQLAVVKEFLVWALDSEHRGGLRPLSLEQLAAERCRFEELLDSLRINARPSRRIEPLDDGNIKSIRDTIGPVCDTDNRWLFPGGNFSRHTQLRNWLMFEFALQLGMRRGELLKLRLDSLPRGSDDGIVLRRLADDPRDSRVREPAVKTAERVIPASRKLLNACRAYLTALPPLGRVRSSSPYLFTTQRGEPLSLDMADDIIQAIGKYSGVSPLSWHRLRHTWAERMAEKLYNEPNGLEQLAYLGGWTNLHSVDHYIQEAKRQHAMECLRTYQGTLYEED